MQDDDADDWKLFDISKAEVEYLRTKNLMSVHLKFFDRAGISEMKLYLLLCRELERLERRLGITRSDEDERH